MKWSEHVLAMNYSTPKYSVPQTQRFKLYSIYWPERTEKRKVQGREVEDVHADAMRISKMIDEEERQARGHKNQIKKRSRTHASPQKHARLTESSLMASRVLPARESHIVERLHVKCPKGRSPPTRDKFGFLNWEVLPQEELGESKQAMDIKSKLDQLSKVEDSMQSTARSQGVSPASRGFSRGKRMDLSRPQNFYPGPGSYRIVRYLENGRRHR